MNTFKYILFILPFSLFVSCLFWFIIGFLFLYFSVFFPLLIYSHSPLIPSPPLPLFIQPTITMGWLVAKDSKFSSLRRKNNKKMSKNCITVGHCWGQRCHQWVNTALPCVETPSALVEMSFLWIQNLVEMSLPWLETLSPPGTNTMYSAQLHLSWKDGPPGVPTALCFQQQSGSTMLVWGGCKMNNSWFCLWFKRGSVVLAQTVLQKRAPVDNPEQTIKIQSETWITVQRSLCSM